MTTMYGADVAALRTLASHFDRTADQLDANRMTVGNAIQISAWVGPFAARFRLQWNSEHSLRIHSTAQLLRAGARTLRANADEQDGASAADTGSFLHGGPWKGATAVSREAPNSATDRVKELASMQQGKEGGDGVRIQKILCDDGKYRYVVYVNGSASTKDGDFGGDLSWQNNAYMILNADNATMQHIRAKIRAAVAGDPHAEVAIVGFSQGGMVAQQLADEGEFNVKAVMTYGSPVLTERHNYGGADVMRLEHRFDPIPRTDVLAVGHRAATEAQTAVESAARAVLGVEQGPARGEDVTFRSGVAFSGKDLLGPHNHEDYGRVAEQFDKSDDPRFDAAKKSFDSFNGTVVLDEK